MRFNVFIVACAVWCGCNASVRFTQSTWCADLGLMMPRLVDGVGKPLDLPQAAAYLVTYNDQQYLEDRYDSFDLWCSHILRGRWIDSSGNQLWIARLDSMPPDDIEQKVMRTRTSFYENLNFESFDRDLAVRLISPVDVGNAAKPRRSKRANLKQVVCYPVKDDEALVYAFHPKSPEPGEATCWYLVVLVLSPNENVNEAREILDQDFLDKISIPSVAVRRRLAKESGENEGGSSLKKSSKDKRSLKKVDTQKNADTKIIQKLKLEENLLRADIRLGVINYPEWHITESDDLVVVDDLNDTIRGSFIAALTNSLPLMRAEYAQRFPSPLVNAQSLAVVRVFRNREEYLAYVGNQAAWTAAVWVPVRRELVLFHTEAGLDELLHTVWHEAFHQYLAYAYCMIESSPWINEGHAELFQNSYFDYKQGIVFVRDVKAAQYVKAHVSELAEIIPSVFEMDYTTFYAGDIESVRARYYLAWSVAYFLEVGAPKLRFRPFENLRTQYGKALISTRHCDESTQQAFGDSKKFEDFISAWYDFWRRQ